MFLIGSDSQVPEQRRSEYCLELCHDIMRIRCWNFKVGWDFAQSTREALLVMDCFNFKHVLFGVGSIALSFTLL